MDVILTILQYSFFGKAVIVPVSDDDVIQNFDAHHFSRRQQILRIHSKNIKLAPDFDLVGPDGKPGCLNTASSKVPLYDHAAETIRTQTPVIHSDLIIAELASIEATTLLRPSGSHAYHAYTYPRP